MCVDQQRRCSMRVMALERVSSVLGVAVACDISGGIIAVVSGCWVSAGQA